MKNCGVIFSVLTAILCLIPVLSGAVAQGVVFVDQLATGSHDGSSWIAAYSNLQDALAASQSGDEIWVAAGTYRPDLGSGVLPGDRDASFVIPGGVSLFGGFSGSEESREDSHPELYRSILSGDLSGNDGGPLRLDNPLRADNARHVVFLDSPTEEIVINGFTISGGFKDTVRSSGSALLFDNYSVPATELTIRNCVVTDNVSTSGTISVNASNYATEISLTLSNSVVESNWADSGAGLQISAARILIDTSIISDNVGRTGSILYAWESDVFIIGSTFAFNESETHGAIHIRGNNSGLLSIWSSRFIGNRSTVYGPGAVHLNETHLVSVNNIFSGNSAASEGGALVLADFTALIVNNVFAFNSAGSRGGAIVSLDKQSSQVSNSIFWKNSAPEGRHIYSLAGDTIRVSNSIADGGFGTDVIDDGSVWDLDPLFIDPDGPDNISGTLDDDFRLSLSSPAIDTGENALLPSDLLDLDGDGNYQEVLPADILGNIRVFDGGSGNPFVDLGAIEFGAPPIITGLVAWNDGVLPQPAFIEVFPNPATSLIHIKWAGRSRSVDLLLFDILGRRIGRLYNGILHKDALISIYLPRVNSGVYLVFESTSGLSAPVIIH